MDAPIFFTRKMEYGGKNGWRGLLWKKKSSFLTSLSQEREENSVVIHFALPLLLYNYLTPN